MENGILSKAEFAAHLGLSRARVSQLINSGLPVEPDGKIDTDKAQRWYAQNIAQAASKPNTRTAEGAGKGSFTEARRKREWVRFEKESFELGKLTGRLLDRAEVEQAAFNAGRVDRECWQNFPVRAASLLAAEFGIDERRLFIFLDRTIRAELEARSSAPSKETTK